MTATKNKLSGKLLALIMIGLATCSFTPIIKHPLIFLFFGVLALYLIRIHSDASGYRRNPRLVICVYLYICVCIIYRLLEISDASFGEILKHILFFIPILLMLLLSDKLTERQSRWIFWIIIVVVLINIVDNIRLCLLHPELYVKVNRGMLAAETMDERINIGGSQFYNAIYFFITVCFFCFLNCSRKAVRYLILGSVILSSVFIFAFCLKASVIVFTCMTIVLLFFAKRASSIRKFAMLIVAPALIAYVFVSLYEDFIIELIFNTFSSDRLAQRLALLIDSDSAEAAKGASTVNARENLWMLSVNTWLDNPINFIFGIGDHRANWMAGERAAETGIGQHSAFFDSLARYGLIGFFLLIAIFKVSFTYLKSLFDKEYHLQILVIILLFVLFGFTKGVFTLAIGCALFLLLPLSTCFVNKKRNEVI